MSDDLRARLAAAKAKRAEIAAEHAPRREQANLEAEVLRQEQAALDDAAIAAAEIKHRGQIECVQTDQGMVVLHKPDPVIYKRFQDLDPASVNVEEIYRVVKSAVEYPDGARFERMITDLPGALMALVQAAGRLMGTAAERVRGKA